MSRNREKKMPVKSQKKAVKKTTRKKQINLKANMERGKKQIKHGVRAKQAKSKKTSKKPSKKPSKKLSTNPSGKPSTNPSRRPSKNPSRKPSKNPSRKPSKNPSKPNKTTIYDEMSSYAQSIGVDWKQVTEKTNQAVEMFDLMKKAVKKGDVNSPEFQFIASAAVDQVKSTVKSARDKKAKMEELIAHHGNSKEVHDVIDNFNSYFQRPQNLDDELEKFLSDHGLSVDQDRLLETKCHFQEIPSVPGHMTKAKLEHFLDEHPGHHLGIFSIRRNDQLECYFINDLYKLVTSDVNHRWSKQDVELISHWHTAYHSLQEVLRNSHYRVKILEFGRLIQPFPLEDYSTKGWFKTLFHKGTKFLKSTFSNMWTLLKFKLLTDIVGASTCFLIKAITMAKLMSMEKLGKLTWRVIGEYLIGEMMMNVYRSIRKLVTGDFVAGREMSTIEWMLSFVMDENRLKPIKMLINACFTAAPGTTRLVTTSLFQGLLYLAPFALIPGVGPLISTISFSAIGSLGYQAILTTAMAEIGWNQVLALIKYLNPFEQEGTLTFLFYMGSPVRFCEILRGDNKWMQGVRAVCNRLAATPLVLKAYAGFIHILVDVIIDILNAAGYDIVSIPIVGKYETRCSKMFAKYSRHTPYQPALELPERPGTLLGYDIPTFLGSGLRDEFGGHRAISEPEVQEELEIL